jgi:hypothetical protein
MNLYNARAGWLALAHKIQLRASPFSFARQRAWYSVRDSPTVEKVSISHDPFSNDGDDADARASLRATGGKGRNMGCGAWIEDSAVGDANVMSGCQWETEGNC